MTIDEFLSRMNKGGQAVPLQRIVELLRELDPDPDALQPFLHFSNQRYQRNLLFRGPGFEALLLCFEAGQRTPIHDHHGSACGVRVLVGEVMETGFNSTTDGWLYATGSATLPANGVTGSQDMDIHQLSNLQAGGARLVTLHIYSPSLKKVGNYSITDNQVVQVTPPVAMPVPDVDHS